MGTIFKNNKNVNVKSQYIPGINLNIHRVLAHSIRLFKQLRMTVCVRILFILF